MAIYKRGNIWWMDVYQGANRRRVRRSTGTADETQARIIEQAAVAVNRGITTRQRAIEIIERIVPSEEAGLKIGDAGAFYLTCVSDEGVALSKCELSHRRGLLNNFCSWALAYTRAEYVSDVTANVAFQFTRHLKGRNVTTSTVNAYVGQLVTIWKTFAKHGKASDNPWVNCRLQRRANEEKHGRVFTNSEIARLRTVCRDVGFDWEGVMTMALYTGLRLYDASNVRWSGDPTKCIIVDTERRVVYGTPAKTARRNIRINVPMHKELYKLVSATRRDGDYVFPKRKGRVNGRHYINGDVPFNEIIKRAGIVDAEHRLSFHCLRHTFVSRLAEAGVAEDVRMRLAGHTSAVTHAIYTHDDVSGRAAIDRLE